jgi:hypothetical protein
LAAAIARTAAAAGLEWGLPAAAIWAGYSVLARLALTSGLAPADTTLPRSAPGRAADGAAV